MVMMVLIFGLFQELKSNFDSKFFLQRMILWMKKVLDITITSVGMCDVCVCVCLYICVSNVVKDICEEM